MKWVARLASSLVFEERFWQTRVVLNVSYEKFSNECRKDPAEGFEYEIEWTKAIEIIFIAYLQMPHFEPGEQAQLSSLKWYFMIITAGSRDCLE